MLTDIWALYKVILSFIEFDPQVRDHALPYKDLLAILIKSQTS